MGNYLRNFMIARDHTSYEVGHRGKEASPPATKSGWIEEQRAGHRPEVQTLGTGVLGHRHTCSSPAFLFTELPGLTC